MLASGPRPVVDVGAGRSCGAGGGLCAAAVRGAPGDERGDGWVVPCWCVQECGDLFGGEGGREVPALPGVAAQFAEPGELGGCFHGFGGDRQSQDVGELDERRRRVEVAVAASNPWWWPPVTKVPASLRVCTGRCRR